MAPAPGGAVNGLDIKSGGSGVSTETIESRRSNLEKELIKFHG
jgi:hypothetical protein